MKIDKLIPFFAGLCSTPSCSERVDIARFHEDGGTAQVAQPVGDFCNQPVAERCTYAVLGNEQACSVRFTCEGQFVYEVRWSLLINPDGTMFSPYDCRGSEDFTALEGPTALLPPSSECVFTRADLDPVRTAANLCALCDEWLSVLASAEPE